MHECERLCAALEGRTISGWRIVTMSAHQSPHSEVHARLVVHVEPGSASADRRPHWSSAVLPIDRLRELLHHPPTLLSELFPPEDDPHLS